MDNTDKYQNILNQYETVNKELQSPDITNDSNKLQQLSIELSELSPVVEKIKELNKKLENLKNTKELIETESNEELLELANLELDDIQEEIDSLNNEIEAMLKETDPNDKRNAIVEIRAGTGGEEAALFASDLFRMYTKYAESQGWSLELLNSHYTGNGGFKEVVFLISGKGVYGKLKYESGVHRVQRVPTTESSGRIHTSAASVVILPEIDDVDIEIDPSEIKVDVYRAGGPGGQSVNTTDSAVRLTHIPTGVVVTCQDEKSQHKNKARAMSILKSKLYEIEQEKQSAEASDLRQSSIRGGDRSVKIRTYNFPESRVTDHRIKKTWHNLSGILDGNLDDVIQEVTTGLENES